MDLRVVKTRDSIKQAFYELRKQKPVQKITVKELCERAQINKATFYLHYDNIYQLSEILEDELIAECFEPLLDRELTDVQKITDDLKQIFTSNEDRFRILFSGNRMHSAVKKIDAFMKKRVFEKHPEKKDDLDFNIRLTILNYGFFQVLSLYGKDHGEQVIESTARLAERMFEPIKEDTCTK